MSEKEPAPALEPYGFGNSMGVAIEKLKQLRQSHDRVLLALRDLVTAHEAVGGRYELVDPADFDAELLGARIAIRRAEEAR